MHTTFEPPTTGNKFESILDSNFGMSIGSPDPMTNNNFFNDDKSAINTKDEETIQDLRSFLNKFDSN
jgi:hypothetical protein